MSGIAEVVDVRLLSPKDPEWTEGLASTPHDFYQLPAYVEFCARHERAEARAISVRGIDESGMVNSLLAPVLVRSVPGGPSGAWDASSPYGYPGVLLLGKSRDDAVATEMLTLAAPHLRGLGCLALFLRLHPLVGATPALAPPLGVTIQHGETVMIDLHRSEDAIWGEMAKGHRTEINQALRAGHVPSFDATFEKLDRFVEIYRATMSRVEASPYYFFDRDYVVGLREALGERLKLAIVEIEGEVAAAGLFVRTGDIVQYHLSGTDERFVRNRPTKLMLDFVRKSSKALGARWFHLGGGIGGVEDSLFRFKAGFSRLRAPFHTCRIVPAPAMYEALCLARGLTPAADLAGFFPAYRSS